MISIDEALALVSSQTFDFRMEIIPISEAVGRVTTDAILATHDLPFFDNSAMDGYAVKGSRQSYFLVGEVAAGASWSEGLEDGQAIRIFTGAAVPNGADAVIAQERVTVMENKIQVSEAPKPGANVRRKGEELKAGDLIFEKGHVLNPAGIGLLASLGLQHVEVVARPRVSILVTGAELMEAGEILNEGQIYESNSATLRAALAQSQLTPSFILKVQDSLEATSNAIKGLLLNSEVVLISGGISVGDYDFVKEAMEKNGVQEIFYKVDQKPGKPLFFGRKGSCFVFALPGNPASTLTCYYLYARPLIERLAELPERPVELKQLKTPLSVKGDRPVILRGRVDGEFVSVLDGQASSMLHSFAYANALIMPSGKNEMSAGEWVKVVRI